MDKWVTVGGGVRVMEHILVSVQVTKVIVGWAPLHCDSCVLSVCCTTLQCRVLHHCGVQNNTQEFSYIMCELWRRKCHGISLTSDFSLRWPVLNVLLALQLGKRVTSLLPLSHFSSSHVSFTLLPCLILPFTEPLPTLCNLAQIFKLSNGVNTSPTDEKGRATLRSD